MNKSQDQQHSGVSAQAQNFNQGIITAHLASALSTITRSLTSNQPIPPTHAQQVKSALTDYNSYCSANGMTFNESIEQ